MLSLASRSMANGAASGVSPSKTAPIPTNRPRTLRACKPFSTSKRHRTLSSPPTNAFQVVRPVETPRSSTRSGTCSSGFRYGGTFMPKLQVQGVHHLTFVGSNRETTIDFYQGVLGMPLVFEQPNLDVPEETHLYFDAGDGRLITFFVRPTRTDDPTHNPQGIGNLHHLALTVSRAVYTQVAERLNELGIWNTGNIDRGF